MIEENFNSVSMLVGARSTGKTPFILGEAKHNIPGLINAYKDRQMKCLGIDTLDHPKWRHIPIMDIEDLPNWKSGNYRIIIPPYEMTDFLNEFNELDSVWNTGVFFEDAYKHCKGELSKPMERLILDSKNKNIDLTYLYHSWMMAPKGLYSLLNSIEIFKVNENPIVRKTEMVYYDKILQAWERVMSNPSQFHHEYVDTGI